MSDQVSAYDEYLAFNLKQLRECWNLGLACHLDGYVELSPFTDPIRDAHYIHARRELLRLGREQSSRKVYTNAA